MGKIRIHTLADCPIGSLTFKQITNDNDIIYIYKKPSIITKALNKKAIQILIIENKKSGHINFAKLEQDIKTHSQNKENRLNPPITLHPPPWSHTKKQLPYPQPHTSTNPTPIHKLGTHLAHSRFPTQIHNTLETKDPIIRAEKHSPLLWMLGIPPKHYASGIAQMASHRYEDEIKIELEDLITQTWKKYTIPAFIRRENINKNNSLINTPDYNRSNHKPSPHPPPKRPTT